MFLGRGQPEIQWGLSSAVCAHCPPVCLFQGKALSWQGATSSATVMCNLSEQRARLHNIGCLHARGPCNLLQWLVSTGSNTAHAPTTRQRPRRHELVPRTQQQLPGHQRGNQLSDARKQRDAADLLPVSRDARCMPASVTSTSASLPAAAAIANADTSLAAPLPCRCCSRLAVALPPAAAAAGWTAARPAAAASPAPPRH
jgi:hypothetical protein